ncbi:MAG: ring-1,2-phenylacetyl-CoA epoxidase subunit PaaE [Crocinitomicaceae bacterium]|jgi:ring-1,2-phenylacetyl-CoA epoxidase subunit PaaE
MTPKFHSLTIKEVRRETEDTVSVSFNVPSDLVNDYQYSAGQYLTLRATINGEDLRRSYSLCSAPHENEWRVAIKSVEDGKFSTYANTELKAGMTLEVMTPTGNFKLTPNVENEKSYALFAAGSGVTPIISILKTILTQEPNSNVTLFYGNKSVFSVIFKEEIEGLKNDYLSNFRVVHVLSRENLGTPLLKGRIDLEKTNLLYKAFLKNSLPDEVYICGPEQMILDVKESMNVNSIDPKHVHFELFTTPSTQNQAKKVVVDEPMIESNVSVIVDGDTFNLYLESTGENLLDAASKSGADLPFACKGGVCCTCKAKILEGTARMDVNYGLEPDEIESGYILTCQAHPTSDKLVVSFDQ